MPSPQPSGPGQSQELEEFLLSDPPPELLFPEQELIPPVETETSNNTASDSIPGSMLQPAPPPVYIPSDSLAGTSAPLLSNPSLTEMLSKFPLLPSGSAMPKTESSESKTQSETADNHSALDRPQPTSSKRGRPRGRPRGSKSSSSLRARTSAGKAPTATQRRRTVRQRAKRWSERGMTLPPLPSVL